MPAPAGWERSERARLSAIALIVLALHGVVAVSFYHRGLSADEVVKPHRIPLVVHFVTDIERLPAKAAVSMTAVDTPKGTPRRQQTAAKHRLAHAAPVDRNSVPSRIAPLKREPAPSKPPSTPAQTRDDQGPPAERASQPVSGSASASPVTLDHRGEGPAHSSAERQTLDAGASADTAPLYQAAYLHNPAPDYPPMALQRRWEGTVLLNVHVLASGSAREVVVVASSGHASLDDAACEAVAGWRFVPARRAGQAIDAWVHVPVIFKAA